MDSDIIRNPGILKIHLALKTECSTAEQRKMKSWIRATTGLVPRPGLQRGSLVSTLPDRMAASAFSYDQYSWHKSITV
jgi:hypothetical protein